LLSYHILHSIPLKRNYFDIGNYQYYRSWERWDLVRRFENASENYTIIFDLLCMNTECLRKQLNYSPKIGEQIDDKCDSVHCNKEICNLKQCSDEELCFDPPFFSLSPHGAALYNEVLCKNEQIQ